MSLFDRRTDTEKELDAYRQSHSTDNRQSSFDKYNNTSNNQNSMQNNMQSNPYDYGAKGPFDTSYNNSNNNQNDIQQNKYDYYGNENNNNFYDSTNQNNSFKDDIHTNNVIDTPKSENQKSSSGVATILVLIWLLGSFAAFIILAVMEKADWAMLVFGQVFLVLGIILCCKSKDNKDKNGKKRKFNFLNLIFPVAGSGIILVCLFYMLADKSLINSFNENILPVLCCSLFAVVGLVMLGVGIVKPIKDKARCSVLVTAEVIDIKRRLSSDSDGGSTWVYAPVYRYYYQGRDYLNESDLYSSSVVKVGTQQEIRLNPNNPNDFIEPKRQVGVAVLAIIMGVIFTVAGICAVMAVLQAG